MRRSLILGIVLLCVVLAPPARAVDMGVGLRAGTQGFGAEYGIGVTKWFGVRAGVYRANVSANRSESGIDYDGTLELGGYGAFLDFYPARGSFRISAGILSNRNGLRLEATPTEDQDIGGVTYTPSEIGMLTGELGFDDRVPYVGIGFGRFAGGRRVGFLFDFGAVYQGSGRVALRSSTGLVDEADLAAEAAEIEDDVRNYKYWPVISFGLAIRF